MNFAGRLQTILLLVVLSVCSQVLAGNWAMFKGDPAHLGTVDEAILPPLSLTWKHTTTPFRSNTSCPISWEWWVYFAVRDTLYCVDMETGEKVWSLRLGALIRCSPALDDGVIFVGDDRGILHAINARSGAQDWMFEAQSAIHSSPVVSKGKIFFGSNDNNIYALNAKNGQLLWSVTTEGPVEASVAVCQNTVYAASGDSKLWAINCDNGRLRWPPYQTGKPAIKSSPAVIDNTVFFGADRYIYAIKARSGEPRWDPFPLDGYLDSSPSVKNGLMYVGTDRGNLYAIDIRNGSVRWQKNMGFPIVGSVILSQRCLWLGTKKGLIRALDLTNGNVLWEYRINSGNKNDGNTYDITASPVVVNGCLYMLGDDGSLYAFRADAMDVIKPRVWDCKLHVVTNRRMILPLNLTSKRQRARATTQAELGSDLVIPGTPPVSMTVQIADEGSGIKSGNLVALVNGSRLACTYDPEKGKVTVKLNDRPAKGSVAKQLADGEYTVTFLITDWKGNVATEEYRFVVDNTLPPIEEPEQVKENAPMEGASPGVPGGPPVP